MNIEINGEAAVLSNSLNVTQLLSEKNVKMPDMVSVELNGEILPRENFDGTIIKENDKIEFLYFMGGGQGDLSI